MSVGESTFLPLYELHVAHVRVKDATFSEEPYYTLHITWKNRPTMSYLS